MILDARAQPACVTLETDVCIVGAGTAGIALAREFIGQSFRVCLLESGGRSPDPQTQSLAVGENVGFPYYPLDTARARFFGGSSTRWHVPMGGEHLGARLRPFDAIDFEQRDWVEYSGWPFDKAHLDPFYDRAQSLCGVEPPTFDAADWDDSTARPKLWLNGEGVQTIIYKLGARDRFVQDYPDAVAQADNITTLLHANVLEIETGAAADHVTRLRVGTIAGTQFFVRASLFVLAAGGIEVPRLLLLSNRVQKTGLGNQHDLVGRFFMEHLHFWSGLLVPAGPDVFRATALYRGVQRMKGVAILAKFALSEETLRREKLLNQNIQLIPLTMEDPFRYWGAHPASVASFLELGSSALRWSKPDRLGQHLQNVVDGVDQIVLAAGRKIRKQLFGLPRIPLYMFSNMTEQVPRPESRVKLGPDCDLFGQNRVQLDWRITAQDIHSAIRTQQIIGGALERAGLGRFYQQLRDHTPPANTEGGYHHMGTTRMHTDPKQGVVDPECRVHGIHNLYIAGPSVFPTGGYANPILTLLALTLRLADHIKQRMR